MGGGCKARNLEAWTSRLETLLQCFLIPMIRVANPDPVLNFSGPGSGFSPDSGTKKNAERSLKVIYQKKT